MVEAIAGCGTSGNDLRSSRDVFLPQFANDSATEQNIEKPDEKNDCELAVETCTWRFLETSTERIAIYALPLSFCAPLRPTHQHPLHRYHANAFLRRPVNGHSPHRRPVALACTGVKHAETNRTRPVPATKLKRSARQRDTLPILVDNAAPVSGKVLCKS